LPLLAADVIRVPLAEGAIGRSRQLFDTIGRA
jgi:hypothetical protein